MGCSGGIVAMNEKYIKLSFGVLMSHDNVSVNGERSLDQPVAATSIRSGDGPRPSSRASYASRRIKSP